MKNKFYLLMAAMLASVMPMFAAAEPDETGMTMDAQTWCRSVKAGWNLGNSLESAGGSWDNNDWAWYDVDRNKWETCWGNPATTEAMIKAVKEAGFNAIRIPVRWEGHITDYDQMTIDPIWMARVKEVVDYAIGQELLVVINTHHEAWLENNPLYTYQEKINSRLSKIWTQIATTFADYDDHLAFAGINEVQINWAQPTTENQAVQNSYNQTFVDAPIMDSMALWCPTMWSKAVSSWSSTTTIPTSIAARRSITIGARNMPATVLLLRATRTR